MTSEPIRVVEVFFSYAHKDERLRNELEKHLTILKRQGYRSIAETTETIIELKQQQADPNNPTMLSEETKELCEGATADLEADNNVLNVRMLTAQGIIDAWGNIRKRTRQKNKSGMLSAYLAYYKVVGIAGSPDHPVVVIQAEKQTHYQYVSEENRYKDLEWALEVEFGLPCSVRLIPPGVIPQAQSVISAVKETTMEDDNKTILTVQKVTEAWESIRKRTKQKNPMLAAYLLYFKVIDTEGPAWRPVIIIQAEKSAHYKYLSNESRYKDLEWSLEEEFGVPCEVRLVQLDVFVVQDF